MAECSATGGTSVSILSPQTQETSQKRVQKDKIENGVGDFAVKSCPLSMMCCYTHRLRAAVAD